MQNYDRDIELDVVLPNVIARNKKQALQEIAKAVCAYCNIAEAKAYAQLLSRENEATSAQSGGVAIPELRFNHIQRQGIIFVRLQRPIPFDALDEKPVDLICTVISSENNSSAHLRKLSRISRLLRSNSLCEKIRETSDEQSIRSLIHSPDGWMMAA